MNYLICLELLYNSYVFLKSQLNKRLCNATSGFETNDEPSITEIEGNPVFNPTPDN